MGGVCCCCCCCFLGCGFPKETPAKTKEQKNGETNYIVFLFSVFFGTLFGGKVSEKQKEEKTCPKYPPQLFVFPFFVFACFSFRYFSSSLCFIDKVEETEEKQENRAGRTNN